MGYRARGPVDRVPMLDEAWDPYQTTLDPQPVS